MSEEHPKLYGELAGWWQLVSPTGDYADEAALFGDLFREAGAKTILELGSGGGNVAWHLKREFVLTLTDVSKEMLAESEKQNPEPEHVEGDMRTLRLGRKFDGVLIHDAVMYMTSEEDLHATFLTASVHCEPGGIVVIAPDWVAETFRLHTSHEGTDDGERGVRYLEWVWDADPNDTEVILALKEGDELRTVVDRHKNGVFPRATWLELLFEAGFETKVLEDPSTDEDRNDIFVGRKRRCLRGRHDFAARHAGERRDGGTPPQSAARKNGSPAEISPFLTTSLTACSSGFVTTTMVAGS